MGCCHANWLAGYTLILPRTVAHLGSGQFGNVDKGLWKHSGHIVEVAVKTCSAESSEEDKVKFLQEAAIMAQFAHPSVVKLYGVVSRGGPVSCSLTLALLPPRYLYRFQYKAHLRCDFILEAIQVAWR